MTTYTAEDFAQATFARHEDGETAMRWQTTFAPWQTSGGVFRTDDGMAEHGWVPVMEVEDWKQRIDDVTAAHDDVRRFLQDTADELRARVDEREATIADLRHDLALAREELVDLRKERERLMTVVANPVSLDSLAAAWEAAGQSDECRKGDVLIQCHPSGGFLVWPARQAERLDSDTRVRERAPRAPWQDLADDLRVAKVDDLDMYAQYLHEAGWRKGGDES